MVIFFSNNAFSASRVGYYTITIPSGTAVTMGDSSVTLPVTVNNLATSTDSIGYVRLDLNANVYYISLVSSAPSGWTVSEIKNAGVGQTYIVFTTTTNKIAIGSSQTFNVVLTGSNNGVLPAAATDQTDSIVDDANGTVMTISAANSNYFQRNATGNSDTWKRKSLYATITASPSSVGPGKTITVIFTVTNRSNAAQANVQPSAMSINSTGTAGATLTSGPTPASVGSLAVGISTVFQWTYTASGSGSLQFCNSARNGANTATSLSVCSGYVAVGDFTAMLSIVPSQIVSGQNISVIMTVTNNGSAAIKNITPSALTFSVLSGSAGSSCSGPSPAKIGNLAPGASSALTWDCAITSAQIGSTFRFYGNATDINGVNSSPNPSYSNTGSISAYSVTVTPDTVYKGNTNVVFTFSIRNGGAFNIQQVQITTPTGMPAFPNPSAPATQTCGANGAIAGSVLTYSGFAGFTPGGTCNFNVTYPTMPNVSANSNYNFTIKIWDTQTPTNKDPRAILGVIVKITVNGVTLDAIPASDAPNCTSLLIASVTPAPADGSVIIFTTSAGTLLDITTTAGGEAQASFKAPIPYDAMVSSATVKAVFLEAFSNATITLTNTAPCPKKIQWREVMQ